MECRKHADDEKKPDKGEDDQKPSGKKSAGCGEHQPEEGSKSPADEPRKPENRYPCKEIDSFFECGK
jgi:hypothetical protein